MATGIDSVIAGLKSQLTSLENNENIATDPELANQLQETLGNYTNALAMKSGTYAAIKNAIASIFQKL